nr:putative Ig domain-containing protein [Granulosicoccus sp.]
MRFNLTLRLLNEYMQMDPSHFIKTTLLTLGLLISGCSGSESGGSRTTGVNLDEGNVTMMLEGQTYELVPAGGAGDGATVQSWRWSDRPIIEGALSQCASIQDFDSPRAATRLEAACSVPAKCNLSFDQVSSVELDGGGQSRFSVRVPVLKADVGVTYRLEATDSSGQTSVGNFTFCLLAINEAPFAENDAFTVTEGIPLVVSGDSGINLLTNDSDDINVGNQALSVSSTPVRPPTQAISFSLQPDGGFTYFYEGDATVVGGTRISDSFQYEITDGSFTSVGTVDLTIVAVDNPPVLNEPLPAQQFIAGVPVDVDFSGFFSDPEDGDLFFSATGLPTGGDLLLTPLGVLTGSPAATDTGEFEVLVEAADQQNSAVGLVSVIVGGNLPPTSTQIPAQEVVFGELFSLDASGFFSDPEDGELVYSLTTAPATEIQINPDTGLITGLITSAGDYQFSVSATDTTDGSATVNFVVTQLAQPNRAPTFDGQINSQSVTIDTGINPASGEFSDPDDDTLTYTINNLPAGLVFNENTGVLSGTPTRLGESVLIITASDPDGLSVSSNAFTIGVTAIPNNAPTFAGTIANQFGNVGTPISPISGNFSDDDGDELQFSSTTLPAGLVINATSGVISGTPAETGTTNVAITATDPRQASATSNIFDIVVAPEINNPPVVTSVSPSSSISVQAEDSATVQINVDDEDTNTLIYSGASNSPTVATVSGGSNGVFTINALSAGSTTLTLTVTDDASQQTTQSINLTVTAIPNVAPVIVGRTPAGSINLDQGDTTAITLTVTDEDLSSLSFSGSTNDAVIAAVTTNADGSFTVTGISEGSTNIILRVEDSQGLAASTSVPVTVSAPPNGAPVITGRTPAAGSLTLAPGDVQIVNLTVTDEDLATVEYSAQSNAPAIASVTVTAANRIRIVAQSDGVATISMTVTDAGGLTDVDTINITVDTPNVAPAITGRTPAASTINLEPGDMQNMTLTVTDESTGTLSYSALTNDSGVVTVSVNAAGTFVITAVDDGDTTIDLTVTDDGNLTDSISVPVSVNTINVAPDITSRSPSTPTIAMLTGETQGMTLTVTDESPATLNYSASSSDPTRATVTVNATGDFTISAQAAGQTTLTLTVEDNGG